MKIWAFALIMFALVCMLIGSSLYKADLEHEEIRDIYNFTESTLTYNGNYTFNELNNNLSGLNIPEIKYFRLARAVDSATNFILVSTFETTKGFVEYGYNNPQHDYKKYSKIMIAILMLSFWAALIPLLIIAVLIYKGIKYLYRKFTNKEKKE